jgi:hypothetical protein
MRSTRAIVATGITVVGLLTSQSASAATRVDQRCLPKRGPLAAYNSATLSQSFQPSGSKVRGVDCVLMARPEQGRDHLRVRLVGRRALLDDESGRITAQLVVLAEKQIEFTMREWSPTWLRMRLPKPIPWSDAGPAVDEYALEIALPDGNSTLGWVACAPYARGEAAVGIDPGSFVDTDTKTAVTASMPEDLAFILYTNR